MNPRAVLEVGPQATPDEIRKAYRRLSLKYHPDRTGGDEEKRRFYTQRMKMRAWRRWHKKGRR